MGFIKGIINYLTDPKLFFALAVLGLVLVVWQREKVASNFGNPAISGINQLPSARFCSVDKRL